MEDDKRYISRSPRKGVANTMFRPRPRGADLAGAVCVPRGATGGESADAAALTAAGPSGLAASARRAVDETGSGAVLSQLRHFLLMKP